MALCEVFGPVAAISQFLLMFLYVLNEALSDILAQRSRRIIWFNRVYRTLWGTGDADTDRYAPYCSLVRACSPLRHRERAISSMPENTS